MIKSTIFERLLKVHREKPRRASVGFSVPFVGEVPVEDKEGPFLVTGARGNWVRSKPKDGVLRYGFSEVLIHEEDLLLTSLIPQLSNYPTVEAAFASIRRYKNEPSVLVMPYSSFSLPSEELDKIQTTQGFISEISECKVYAANTPKIIVVAQSLVRGNYVRSGDYLGVTLHSVNSAWCTVDHDGKSVVI